MNAPIIVGQIEHRRIDQLVANPRNARTHSDSQIEQIAASIREFGFVNALLIGPDDVIIAGHARLLAARKLSMREVPVIVLTHLTASQRRALVIADDQLALNAGWDEEKLRSELAALAENGANLEALGFGERELERLVKGLDPLADPDAIPPAPEAPVTVAGNLWLMGEHRLLCGDGSKREAIDAVLGGRPAEVVFADPPENADYEFLYAACTHLVAASHGAIYICTPSSGQHTLHKAFTEAGGHWSTFLIWAKHQFTPEQSDYQHQYELILYGWRNGGEHFWGGGRHQGDVWSIPQPAANRGNPKLKPVELVQRAVENSSRRSDTVLDPFAGSGTTLIACERQKRKARLIELDPRCADIICQRWQQYSGEPAILDGEGGTFTELAQIGETNTGPNRL